MNQDTFQRLVSEALDDLPAMFQEKLDNIQVVIEDWPDQRTMQLAGVRNNSHLDKV
jgi:predicted Zn-dependent protease with MMP-like domain